MEGTGRQIVDVDLDEIRPAASAGKLLEIDRRGDADREGQEQGHEERIEGAHRRAPNPRKLGFARIAAREECGIETLLDLPPLDELVDPGDLLGLQSRGGSCRYLREHTRKCAFDQSAVIRCG